MTRTLALMVLAIVPVFVATASADDVSKKDRALAAKSSHHRPPPPPGAKPGPLINVYNQRTHEWLAIAPTDPPDRTTIDRFLRDHFTNKPTQMDPRLVTMVTAAAINFHADTAYVVSGFRHPKYNLILRKKGHQVARDSQHSHGNAVDFYLPNIPTLRLHAWAKQQKQGGVGLYIDSGFVHMDTGQVRYWSGE